jgi:hypothetical protein
MDEIVKLKGCKTRHRWKTAIKDTEGFSGAGVFGTMTIVNAPTV